MRLLLFMLCAGFLCSCSKPKPPAPPIDPLLFTPEQVLDSSDFWTYRDAVAFCDGGSVALGFINGRGRIIFLWFDPPSMDEAKNRRCFLKRYFDDPAAVEIPRHSPLETKVLAMMDSAHEPRWGDAPPRLPPLELARKILSSRSQRLSFLQPPAMDQEEPNRPFRLVPMKPSSLPEARGTPRDHHPPSPPPFSDMLSVPALQEVMNPVPEEPEDWIMDDGGTTDSETRQSGRAGE